MVTPSSGGDCRVIGGGFGVVGFGGDGRECGCCGGVGAGSGGGFYCGVGDCGGILKNIVIHLYAVYETGVLEDMICGRKFMFF